jgi:hypothetical protein
VDHAGAQDRHPARLRAGRAADAAADDALDVEGDRRLGERVVAGPEARLARPEQRVGELVEQALEVRHRGALVDHQAFDLEELEAVAGVDRLVAEAAARQQRPDRRLGGLHHPDLAGARVGPQQVPGDVHVERVPQVAGRMVRGDVEHLEVGQVVLDLGPLVDHEAELAEDLGDGGDRLRNRVERAAPDRPAGQRDVDLLRARRRAWTCACSSVPRSRQAALTASPPRWRRRRLAAGPPPAARRCRAARPSGRPSCRDTGSGAPRGRPDPPPPNLLQGPLLQASQIALRLSKSTLPFLTSRARPAASLSGESRTLDSGCPGWDVRHPSDGDESRARGTTPLFGRALSAVVGRRPRAT